ncbi:MAG TPA: hypothetical protein VFN56_03740 [Candidatus Saccharimonadales bacterium]|nr:hypothetical protein [Candidatus Saccharimonadales bacterium]
MQLRRYSFIVSKTREGTAFASLSEGAKWLAWGLPVPALISIILNSIANSHPGFTAAATIISNYVSLTVPLVAFNFMSSGSRSLLQKDKLQVTAQSAKLLVLGFVIIGVVFCYFIFRNLASLHAVSSQGPYYLPNWLLILTIIIPYLYSWLIGLLAAYEMWLVGNNVAGLLYRRSLQTMSRAIIIIVGASIAIQYIQSVNPSHGRLSLGYIVVFIYFILLIYAVGFILLALASNRLKKIEEV